MNRQESSVPGLYIHIPFCKRRCGYCDFYSVTDTRLITGFLDALFKEIDKYREEFREFDTVYIGGGTPSLLSLDQIKALLDKIRHDFTILSGAEITIEVNPADWGKNDLNKARDMGINRISIGVQSFNEEELIFLGRRHNSGQAMRTIQDALDAGFGNIGIDLIYGLPCQTFQQWQDSLLKGLSLEPAHLSCYELELKDRTPLGLKCEKGEFPLRTEDAGRDFFMRTSEILEESGYIHYEISNFARGMDKASRHNQKYWDHTPYLGLGPSAHSFKDGRRWWNHESLHDYISNLEGSLLPAGSSEELTGEQLRLEALFLGLRTRKGIDLVEYHRRYGYDLMEEKGQVLKELSRTGLVEIECGFIRPTRAGMAIADSLALL
jgi:oxygen-independent coproporphyrinogen-3 oxidase